MSSRSVPTTIIGPKGLLRDSLASLLGHYSYQVTDSHQTVAEMPSPPEEDGPRMVLLTAPTVDVAVAECASIRQTCANCKIVGLLEDILDEDFQKLAHSPIDGCVSLNVSQEVLTRTLDLVMSGSARIIVTTDDPSPSISPAEGQAKVDPDTGSSSGGSSKKAATVTKHDGPPVATTRSGDLPVTAAIPGLSEREKQIIDGVLKGQSNKIIARACGIAEATVKVHMKAILRKLPCFNRTQVAIWALEHDDAIHAPPMNGTFVAPCLRPAK